MGAAERLRSFLLEDEAPVIARAPVPTPKPTRAPRRRPGPARASAPTAWFDLAAEPVHGDARARHRPRSRDEPSVGVVGTAPGATTYAMGLAARLAGSSGARSALMCVVDAGAVATVRGRRPTVGARRLLAAVGAALSTDPPRTLNGIGRVARLDVDGAAPSAAADVQAARAAAAHAPTVVLLLGAHGPSLDEALVGHDVLVACLPPGSATTLEALARERLAAVDPDARHLTVVAPRLRSRAALRAALKQTQEVLP